MKSVVDVNPATRRRVVSTGIALSRAMILHEIFIPLHGIGVEPLIERAPSHRSPPIRFPSAVELSHRAPVKRASDDIPALLGVRRVIPPRFHKVNFSIGCSLNARLDRDCITHPLIGQIP